MESISTSVETPAVSGGEVVESPSTPAASSGGVAEAGGVQPPDVAQSQTVNGGESVATPSGDEFPDEAAFQQLPGEQRVSALQNMRGRISDLNKRVAELAPLESFKPISETIDQFGGWESVEPLLELATSLNAPVLGEDGNPTIDPQTGLPQYTAAPFVEKLAVQSLGTLDDILWRAFDIPYGQETLGHRLFRERLGLDPTLLSAYQQIQSPDQAREYITRSGGIDPALFEGVNPSYHDALRSLISTRPGLSQQWEHLDDEAKSELLQDRKELLENRKYAEEQRRRDEQSAQEREANAKLQVENAGWQAISAADQRVRNAQLAKLKQTAVFFADEADNADVWDDILGRSAQEVINDTTLKPKLEEWRAWHMQLAAHEATGDRLKASQAKVEIGKLERKLEKEFADRVTARTGLWSRRLGGARAVHQQQIQDAKPRIEIDGGGDVSDGAQSLAYSPPPTGRRFGMSEERKQQLAAELAARRMS